MLLDALMPVFDVVERHAVVVRATPAATYAAIRATDLTGGAVTRTLLTLRGLPAVMAAVVRSPANARAALDTVRRDRAQARLGLAPFERAGFRVVAERAPEELVVGLLGSFWTPSGGLCSSVSARDFAADPPAGMALAGWNFVVRPQGDGACELSTETRVRCAPNARRRFLAYWFVVRPGSGIIRRIMLRAIRRQAEGGAASISGGTPDDQH